MKTFTYDEVYAILANVYEHYEISSTDKFMRQNLSNFSNEPSMEAVMKAEKSDIESFIF